MPTVGRVIAEWANVPLSTVVRKANTSIKLLKRNGALTDLGKEMYAKERSLTGTKSVKDAAKSTFSYIC